MIGVKELQEGRWVNGVKLELGQEMEQGLRQLTMLVSPLHLRRILLHLMILLLKLLILLEQHVVATCHNG